jgi:hypothetical protein
VTVFGVLAVPWEAVCCCCLVGVRGCGGAHGEYIYSKLNQIFQCLLIKNQEVDMGLMNMDANHCGDSFSCTLGGRLLLLLGWRGEGVVGLMENIFYSKLNQIFQSFVLNTQDLDKGLMKTDSNHCGELHLGRRLLLVGRGARV